MMNHDTRLERLAGIDACALSDALDSLGKSTAVAGIPRRATRRRLTGRVQTLRLTSTPPAEPGTNHLGARSIAGATPGDVLVIEQRTGIDAAGFGGVLANAARVRGLRGVIIDGPARDIDECDAIDFPVFSRSATARTARGRVYESEVNGVVTIGDVTVRAGDYVVADASGIVFVGEGVIEDVLSRAEAIAGRERAMTARILDGAPVTDVLGMDYETMLRR